MFTEQNANIKKDLLRNFISHIIAFDIQSLKLIYFF